MFIHIASLDEFNYGNLHDITLELTTKHKKILAYSEDFIHSKVFLSQSEMTACHIELLKIFSSRTITS